VNNSVETLPWKDLGIWASALFSGLHYSPVVLANQMLVLTVRHRDNGTMHVNSPLNW